MKDIKEGLNLISYVNLHMVLNPKLQRKLISDINSQVAHLDFKLESRLRFPLYELLYEKFESPLYDSLRSQIKHLK